VPATFFVNSDRVDIEHERDWDVLERLFLSEVPLPARLTLEGPPAGLDAATRTTAERADALDAIHRLMWPLDVDGRAALVRAILGWSGATPAVRASHRVLTGAEIRELASRSGHTLGAHTTHHLALTTQPADTKRREVAGDKATLERVLGQPVTLFSYPYGEFDAELAGIVSDAGFHAAVTVASGVVRPGSNRLVLPRLEPTPTDARAFREWLAAPFASRY
jgi:peptidoglycan/xylan/chitin deacetylase (PgdA/CDA1 family)